MKKKPEPRKHDFDKLVCRHCGQLWYWEFQKPIECRPAAKGVHSALARLPRR